MDWLLISAVIALSRCFSFWRCIARISSGKSGSGAFDGAPTGGYTEEEEEEEEEVLYMPTGDALVAANEPEPEAVLVVGGPMGALILMGDPIADAFLRRELDEPILSCRL